MPNPLIFKLSFQKVPKPKHTQSIHFSALVSYLDITFSCTVCTCQGSSSLFHFHMEILPSSAMFSITHSTSFSYAIFSLPCLSLLFVGAFAEPYYTYWHRTHFLLVHVADSCPEERQLVPLWPSSSPPRLQFLGLHIFIAACCSVLIPAQHRNLAQPVTASITSQYTPNHKHAV